MKSFFQISEMLQQPKINFETRPYNQLYTILQQLSHKQQVAFAFHCATDIKQEEPKALECIRLVRLWLKDEKSVTEEQLRSAANAVYYATYAAAARSAARSAASAAYAASAADASAATYAADAASAAANTARSAAKSASAASAAAWAASAASARAAKKYQEKMHEYIQLANSLLPDYKFADNPSKDEIIFCNFVKDNQLAILLDMLDDNKLTLSFLRKADNVVILKIYNKELEFVGENNSEIAERMLDNHFVRNYLSKLC